MGKECDAKASRREIAQALPRAIRTALASYQRFIGQEDSEDAKSFKAHHDACKMAIAHIDLLIKLAESLESEAAVNDGGGLDDALLSQMIESAREVQAYQERMEGKDVP